MICVRITQWKVEWRGPRPCSFLVRRVAVSWPWLQGLVHLHKGHNLTPHHAMLRKCLYYALREFGRQIGLGKQGGSREEVKIYLTGFDPSASRSEQFEAEWDDYVGILWLERPEDAHEQGADANITWNPRRMWLEEGAIQAAYEAMPAWARGWDVVIIHTASDPGKPPQWELHRHAWQGRILPAKWQYALPEDDDPSWRECSKPTGTSGNSGMWRPRRVALAFRTP